MDIKVSGDEAVKKLQALVKKFDEQNMARNAQKWAADLKVRPEGGRDPFQARVMGTSSACSVPGGRVCPLNGMCPSLQSGKRSAAAHEYFEKLRARLESERKEAEELGVDPLAFSAVKNLERWQEFEARVQKASHRTNLTIPACPGTLERPCPACCSPEAGGHPLGQGG